MKTKELFERIEGKGYDVDFTLSPFGSNHLNVNINYRDIIQDKALHDNQEYVRQYMLMQGAKTHPEVEKLGTEYRAYVSTITKETEAQIGELVQAYKNMIYGLITLSETKCEQYWQQNVESQIPQETKDYVNGQMKR